MLAFLISSQRTGLIFWAGNKHLVMMAWQSSTVGVEIDDGHLLILDPVWAERLVRHELCLDKGKQIINQHHYRDPEQRIPVLEQQLIERLGDAIAHNLCQRLRQREPKIYKDQLVGILKQIQRYPELPLDVLKRNPVWRFHNAAGDAETFVPRPRLRTDEIQFAVDAVMKDMGVACLPGYIAQQWLDSGELELLLPEWKMEGRAVNILFPHRQNLPVKTRAFIDFVIERSGR